MNYQNQQSTLTLREGLDEFHSLLENPMNGDLSPKVEELFHCYDIALITFIYSTSS
ncbi:MAG: hypothetical protein AB8C84_12115 [Oligoflexales bacterium]